MNRIVKIIYLLSFCFVVLNACKKTEIKGDINYSVNKIFTASFNYTLGANNYNWDFGDNNFSSLSNPVHRYKYGGLYHVKLNVNGQKIEKDVTIATPDTLAITSFTLRKTPFYYSDSNGLYNIYWNIFNDRTGETYTSPIIMGINPSNLPLTWNNIDANVSLANLSDPAYIRIGFYRQVNNSYREVSGYSFTFNYLLGYYGYQDTLYLGDTSSACQFEFSTGWNAY